MVHDCCTGLGMCVQVTTQDSGLIERDIKNLTYIRASGLFTHVIQMKIERND